jgi:hypothetical protein
MVAEDSSSEPTIKKFSFPCDGSLILLSILKSDTGSAVAWRREWDSNPRYGFPHTRFPSVRLKPLGHLSGWPVLKGHGDFCK